MRTQPVYDQPLRVFHWLFAGLFVIAFGIAKTVDDEAQLFSYHMLAGLLLAFLVVLRLLWGVIGPRHSSFASFALWPSDLFTYLRGIFTGDRRRWAGHNPASSWAALAMLGLALGLAVSGIGMANGYKEQLEDAHEFMAHAFLVVVLLHVGGVILHGLWHRDGIALSMIDGLKSGVPENEVIRLRPVHQLVTVGLLVVMALATQRLFAGYDSASRTLKIFAATLNLGEAEHLEKEIESEGDDD